MSVQFKQFGLHKNGVQRRLGPDPFLQLRFKIPTKMYYKPTPSQVFFDTKKLMELFIHSWSLLRVRSNSEYKTHRDFQLMFMSFAPEKGANALFDARKFFSRWLNSYNFLFNLFYVESIGQLLSNKMFIEESLVFNWQNNLTSYQLFKYIQPAFIFKDLPYGGYLRSTMLNLLEKKVDYTLVVDLNNHKKLLSILRSYNFFMIGLVPSNYSPWLVSFAIPAFSDSLLLQLYFVKLMFRIKAQAELKKYEYKSTLLV